MFCEIKIISEAKRWKIHLDSQTTQVKGLYLHSNYPEFNLNQYYIYKDLKNVESVTFDSKFRYMLVLCSSTIFHLYDNLTKLHLGKIDFLELLKSSSINSQYEASLKSIPEKDRHRIFDSISFCKNPDFFAIASSKLATIFLIKTNLTTIYNEDSPPSELFGYIQVKSQPSKECPLTVTMDPFSKYDCLVSNNNVAITNFKSLLDFKIPIIKPDKEMEISTDKSKEKENNDDLNVAYAVYLERYSSKTVKTIVVCNQDLICVYEVKFDKTSNRYDHLQPLFNFVNNNPLRVSHIHLNYRNNLLAVKYFKKYAKVFSFDFKKRTITQKVEFEVIFSY